MELVIRFNNAPVFQEALFDFFEPRCVHGGEHHWEFGVGFILGFLLVLSHFPFFSLRLCGIFFKQWH